MEAFCRVQYSGEVCEVTLPTEARVRLQGRWSAPVAPQATSRWGGPRGSRTHIEILTPNFRLASICGFACPYFCPARYGSLMRDGLFDAGCVLRS